MIGPDEVHQIGSEPYAAIIYLISIITIIIITIIDINTDINIDISQY